MYWARLSARGGRCLLVSYCHHLKLKLTRKNIKIARGVTHFLRGFDINGTAAGDSRSGTNIPDRISGGAGAHRAWIKQTNTADYLLAAA
ncbi:MAG: hypothetical protein BWK76_26995 [Desulfobulbaceae bacterium A2]|nr:MAG: hypothetical protein BWK76_26995 [Desulfobulbaceae bacterium A2]